MSEKPVDDEPVKIASVVVATLFLKWLLFVCSIRMVKRNKKNKNWVSDVFFCSCVVFRFCFCFFFIIIIIHFNCRCPIGHLFVFFFNVASSASEICWPPSNNRFFVHLNFSTGEGWVGVTRPGDKPTPPPVADRSGRRQLYTTVLVKEGFFFLRFYFCLRFRLRLSTSFGASGRRNV